MAEFIHEAIQKNHVRYYENSLENWQVQRLDETQRIIPELKLLLRDKIVL